ncbi:MAG: DedA family protein [Patescibacteria group bacterium]|nr:DedA family protein [Patescibacteria group bacterium]
MFDSFLEYYNDFSAIFIVLGSALEGENSLLLLSGVSYTLGHSYWYVVGLAVIGGILGESIGYTLGKYNKERIYSIPVLSHIVTEKRVKVMEHFYQNHGGKTLVIIRFIYGLRTAGAIMAGMSGMRTTKFYIYNIF